MTIAALIALLPLAACRSSSGSAAPTDPVASSSAPIVSGREADDRLPTLSTRSPSTPPTPLPGMPPVPTPAAGGVNVYADATVGHVRPELANDKAYVYVPSNDRGTVTEIDQATMKVVTTFRVGKLAQHVVPSYDMSVLYANASGANALVPIDPATGQPGKAIKVEAPYNLYFTPDGQHAVVMAERKEHIDYYDPTTWKLQRTIDAPCRGVNHADWSLDGRWFLVTCEFSGQMLQVDTATGDIMKTIDLPSGSMPQDVRLTPDGKQFYVADMQHDGVWVIDASTLQVGQLIPTGMGAHGIYPSRDGKLFYITNRGRMANDPLGPSHEGQGTISVLDPARGMVVATWTIPGGGSPDMGGVSADGKVLWLSGRFDSVVYAFDTDSGALLAKIAVPPGPHGLCVFPQPGRYSLGHTGNYR
jgi:YVTN family beta-propeller protein